MRKSTLFCVSLLVALSPVWNPTCRRSSQKTNSITPAGTFFEVITLAISPRMDATAYASLAGRLTQTLGRSTVL